MEKMIIEGVEPVAAARPRVTRTGHAFMPDKTIRFENLVASEYRKQCSEQFLGPVKLRIRLTYMAPLSLSHRKRESLIDTFRDKKPDCDNLAKAIMDGLEKGGAFLTGDGQVAILEVEKIYGREYRIEIQLESI